MDAQATPPPWPARPAVVKTGEPEPEEPEESEKPGKVAKAERSSKSEKSARPDNVVKSVKPVQPAPPPKSPMVPVPPARDDSDVLAVAVFQPRAVSLPRDFIRRCVTVIAVATLLGGVIGFAVAKISTPVYGARSEILFQLGDANPTGFLREDRRLSTQLVALKSREVLGPVASANKMSYEDLVKKVSVTVLDESEILRIQVADPSKDKAAKLTKDVVARFLETAPSRANADVQQFLTKQIADIDAALALLREQANRLESQNPNGPSTPAQLRIQSEIQAKLDQRGSAADRLNDATVQGINQPRVEKLTDVYALDSPVAPKPVKSGIAGALAGFMIGLVAAAFMVWRRLARDRSAG
jgi:hypothetical protein